MEIRKNEKNQVYIKKRDAIILVSYTTIIAVYIPSKKTIFKSDKFYSRTTSKHYNSWKAYYNIDGDGIKTELETEYNLNLILD